VYEFYTFCACAYYAGIILRYYILDTYRCSVSVVFTSFALWTHRNQQSSDFVVRYRAFLTFLDVAFGCCKTFFIKLCDYML
jgi:hypothetical protein